MATTEIVANVCGALTMWQVLLGVLTEASTFS